MMAIPVLLMTFAMAIFVRAVRMMAEPVMTATNAPAISVKEPHVSAPQTRQLPVMTVMNVPLTIFVMVIYVRDDLILEHHALTTEINALMKFARV